MESAEKKGELQQLKEVVKKVFEYTPPAKDAVQKRVMQERGVKHRRSKLAGKELAPSG